MINLEQRRNILEAGGYFSRKVMPETEADRKLKEVYKKQLPEGFGPWDTRWKSPGYASYRQKWKFIHGPE